MIRHMRNVFRAVALIAMLTILALSVVPPTGGRLPAFRTSSSTS
jgi:hypothetical protein